ncbi:hypothetical protein [Desertibacillus haloalkaliphilus]|uniref:hypothetical protein n=1 Tax=Desertibacillus haloalkaliphilus TaxID=1328930 RepID=UPI001C25A7F4|nr:hypothetical protein [Desertibacillus haloalkaliphilus]MBU8907421.1 hypothetical protein [Desertibacillus haloalkaliphilus]
MSEKNKQIESLLDTLNEWKGSDISIEKEEKNDIDKNTMSLEDVAVVQQPNDEDDYVDPYTIELKGIGTVLNHNGTSQLPLNSYELPLKQLLSFEASNEFLTIKTDRATYILKNQ